MKRNQLLVAVLVLAVVVIYFAQDRLQTASANAVEAPMFEVDPFWPNQLPDHWVLGSAIGVGVDSRDHVFIVHRGNLTERTEGGADADPPIGECCRAAPPVLEFDPRGQPRQLVGRPLRRVCVARLEPRDHGRPHGQHLDRRERAERHPRPQVLARRRIPGFVRRAGGRSGGQQQPDALQPGRQAVLRRRSQRGLPRRRLRRPPRRRARRLDGRLQALLGRLRKRAGRHANAGLRSGCPAHPAVPHSGALRRTLARRLRVRVRPSQRPDPGLPEGRDLRGRGPDRAAHAGRRVDVGHRLLARPRGRGTCTWPTGRT